MAQKHHSHKHHHSRHGDMKRRIILIAVTAVLLAVAIIVERHCNLPAWQLLLIYLIPYLLVGADTLKEAAEGIAHGDVFNENFLMTIVHRLPAWSRNGVP